MRQPVQHLFNGRQQEEEAKAALLAKFLDAGRKRAYSGNSWKIRAAKRHFAAVWVPGSSHMKIAMKRTILSLLIIVLAVAAVRVPLLNIPFERDEGEYAYIAWRLGHGELPYRDWVDQKPPAIFWAYQLALSQPLDPVRAVHLMGLLWSAASACALFLLASRFMKPFWALAAAVLLGLLSAGPSMEGTAANTEVFMLLPLILAQIAFFRAGTADRRGVLFMIMAGALTGIAAAFKQVAMVNWFFLVAIYPVFVAGKNRLRQTVSFAAWSAAGVAFIWGLIAAYFFLRHGLADFIDNVFTHNLEYINTVPWPQRLLCCRKTLATLWPAQALVWIFSVMGWVALLAPRRIKLLLFLAGWMVASLIGVSASGYFYPHYFQQLLPVLAVAAALGAEALDELRFTKNFPAWGRRTILGGLITLPPVLVIYPFIFSYSPAEIIGRIYPGDAFAVDRFLGERIAQITRPDDRVFIFGAEPQVLFYAQRVSATRYIFLFPLYGPYRDALNKQIATANEISENQPAAALYQANGLFFIPGSEQYFTQWSRSYLKDNFRADTYMIMGSSNNIRFISNIPKQALSDSDRNHTIGIVFIRKNDNDGAGKTGSSGSNAEKF
jgi:hypothetical protein